ncbi:hypothetical protein WNY37_16190 [Henriciella sp. AS95]|uniref:hypothetical protein n=1 Tax=Henriciella sp. AS95 TaxID=3135782 RepID=UPI00316D5807
MAAWIIPVLAIIIFGSLIALANTKLGGRVRKDGRPHQAPWGFIMVFCVLGIFMAVVHLFNVVGLETGPEHSLMGRFGG